MVGNGKGDNAYYRCDWRYRAGREACQQPTLVAYVPHNAVCDWIASEIGTYDRLLSLRDQFAESFSGASSGLRERQDHLKGEMDRVSKQIGHLLTALERGGWSEDIQERLHERKRERLGIETDLAGIAQRLKIGKIRISDEVIHYMAEHMQEALTTRHPDYARRIIRMIVAKAGLFKTEIRLQYTPEIVMESLALSDAQRETWLWTVPPWGSVPKPSLPLLIHGLPYERPFRSRYHVEV